MTPSPEKAFDFGENWNEFSTHALDAAKVIQARRQFAELTARVPLAGHTFLDIGFGQGLGLLSAAALGAAGSGCDINPKCAAVLRQNLRYFPDVKALPPALVGSILDDGVLERLRDLSPQRRGYEIVHSWGVLHHTGDMSRAIGNAASLVAPGGHLILALYNRHWSSPVWRIIKRLYVHAPRWLQRTFIAILYPVIYLAKWAVTRRNPKLQERGMDFYYDVIDWVGGYPYEYAARAEIERLATAAGLQPIWFRAARVPTGCHEYIFWKNPGAP